MTTGKDAAQELVSGGAFPVATTEQELHAREQKVWRDTKFNLHNWASAIAQDWQDKGRIRPGTASTVASMLKGMAAKAGAEPQFG